MIEVKNLSKNFKVFRKDPGLKAAVKSLFHREFVTKHALRGVDLEIPPGETIGLIGANGAGKTTLVKILSGIIHPSGGEARVLGHNPWERKNEFRKQIALIMGQKAQLWWDLPAGDCFTLLKEIYEIPDRQYKETLGRLTEVLGVGDQMAVQIRRLSLGERMKMELIAALLHSPKVVFLDEPTIGLDLNAQKAIREFILSYQKEKRPAIIITSHYMEDIEELCKRVVIIREGEFVYDGALNQIVSRYAKRKRITVHLRSEPQNLSREAIEKMGEIVHWNENELCLKVNREEISTAAAQLLQGLPVSDLNIEEPEISTIVANILREKGKLQ